MPLGKKSSKRDDPPPRDQMTAPGSDSERVPARSAARPPAGGTSANLFALRMGALLGVAGLATALGAILISSGVQGWLTGLIIGLVSTLLTIGVWSIKSI